MKNKDLRIGFIGAGLMGYGMAFNLLNKKISLSVISHNNRKPINSLISHGAIESKTLKDLANFSNVIIMCVTNTPIAKDVVNEILPYLKKEILFIDITTHHSEGSIQINNILKKNKIKYVESPVMGGPTQAKEGVLGAIVGSSNKDFIDAKPILKNFCKDVFYFGKIGMGAKTKLISNFLSLGTATLVIETITAANHFNIDLKKLYEVSKLGSGNSGALKRIADKAIKDDYKGYIFTVKNALKDLTYINKLLKNVSNADKLSSLIMSLYKKAVKNGKGDLLISELIKKKNRKTSKKTLI